MEIAEPAVTLTCGKQLRAPAIVVACGLGANGLLGKLAASKERPAGDQRPLRPLLHHQLVELGYGASAHGGGAPRWR
ncbi:hypothetical protein DMH17_05815 [Raoultella planticola]|nr:hypothetical protein [Raoultella planticola]